MNAREQYAAVKDGSEQLTPEQLFNLASELAVTGDYAAKRELYEEHIYPHPMASEADRFRVDTYRYGDMLRRDGEHFEALKSLKGMTIPTGAPTRVIADYWLAVAQCYLKSGNPTWALTNQRKVMALPGWKTLPVDFRLYVVEGLMDIKMRCDQFDAELERSFEEYEKDLNDPLLTDTKRERAVSMYEYFRSLRALHKRQYLAAADHQLRAFNLAPAERNKALCALFFIYAVVLGNLEHAAAADMADYYREHQEKLLKTDVQTFVAEYRRVNQALGVRPVHEV